MRVYANCFARAYCYARVSSKRGQLRCEGPADEGLRRFLLLVAIDCSAIDHEVIDRNEISIVNVHSC